MAKQYPWVMDEYVEAHGDGDNHKLPKYPADHKLGMVVPKGGSNCAKCEYLAGKQKCGQKIFIAWGGEDKPAGSNKIPHNVNAYCCDFFEAK